MWVKKDCSEHPRPCLQLAFVYYSRHCSNVKICHPQAEEEDPGIKQEILKKNHSDLLDN